MKTKLVNQRLAKTKKNIKPKPGEDKNTLNQSKKTKQVNQSPVKTKYEIPVKTNIKPK